MRAVALGEESLKNISAPVVAWIAAPESAAASWLEAAAARRREQKASPVSAGPASIAVLPFVNMSADPENEYFSDGLSEELLNVLVKVTPLRVIARTSSFAFKGKSVTVGEIAKQLGVGHVLEGSVRKAANRVRVTAQLIRASDDAHLWSETYDRTLDDIFAVQDDISKEVVEALKLKLAAPAPSVSDAGGTSDVMALEDYLRGRYLSENGSGGEAGLRATLAAFDAAVARDPHYARAHLDRASALWSLGGYGHIEADEAARLVLAALAEALRIAPNLGDALALRGLTSFLNGRSVRRAQEDFDRAQSAGPGSSFVQRLLAMFEQGCGRGEAAVRAARKSVELDPLSPRARFMLSETLYYARRFEEGEAVVRAAIATAPPGARNLYGGLGCYLAMQGRTQEALAAFDEESTEWLKLAGRAWTYALAGDLAAARRALAAYRQSFGDSGCYQYATIFTLLGERDEALAMLEEARLKRDPGLMGYVLCDPMLDALRGDPRFQRLIEALGLTCT
jgi:TolB-like protein/Flp pilus assembly protein TadD